LKNKNKNEGENNYVRYVEINFVNESNTRLIAECISELPFLNLYYGLNKSDLKNVWKSIILCYEKFR